MHLRTASFLLPLLLASGSVGAQTLRTWNAGDGVWADDASWTPFGFPDGPEFSAIVDSGAGPGKTVTSTQSLTLGRLRIGVLDRVILGNSVLTNTNGFPGAGVIDIGGVLEVTGSVQFPTDATLSGLGGVELSAGGTLVIDPLMKLTSQVLIHGNGIISMSSDNGAGSPFSTLANEGVIRAEAADDIEISGGHILNSSRIEVENTGRLFLHGNVTTGTADSLVERQPGGILHALSSTFIGETLVSADDGDAITLSNCAFDGVDRPMDLTGLFTIGSGFNLFTGSIRNQGVLRFEMTNSGGGNQGLMFRDTPLGPTTFTGGGLIDFPPGDYYSQVFGDVYSTNPVHTIKNVDNTITGEVTFNNVNFLNEENGVVKADRPGKSITFLGFSQTSQSNTVINAGFLRASGGGTLSIQCPLITVGEARVVVSGNSLLTVAGGSLVGGNIINSNTSFNVVNNRGIELIGRCMLDGRFSHPVNITGLAYADSIYLGGRIKAPNGEGTGSIQNRGPITLLYPTILDGIQLVLANTGVNNSSIDSIAELGDELELQGGAFIAGAGTLQVNMVVNPGSEVTALGGSLWMERFNQFGTPMVIRNYGSLDAGQSGSLHIDNMVINDHLLANPPSTAGQINAYAGGSVYITGEVRQGYIVNRGSTADEFSGAYLEFDGASFWETTFDATERSSLGAVFKAGAQSNFRGSITNHASMVVREGQSGAISSILVKENVLLAGSGKIHFEGAGSTIEDFGLDVPARLTQGPGHTLSGSVTIKIPFVNNGVLLVLPGHDSTISGQVSGSGLYHTINGKITLQSNANFSGAGGGLKADGPQAQIRIEPPPTGGGPLTGLVFNNGAGLVGLNGSNVLSVGDRELRAGPGGQIKLDNGSGLTVQGGTGVVANGGGNVISGNGSTVVANGGGNIVAVGGGNIVAVGGGNVVANGGGNAQGGQTGTRFRLSGLPVLPGLDVTPTNSVIVAQAGGTITGDMNLEADNGVWIEQGGFLKPGGPIGAIGVTGLLYLATGSLLTVDIGGLAAVSQHDRITVDGPVEIGGDLQVELANGFAPALGDTFTILSAVSLTGAFDSLDLPALPGRKTFRVDYTAQDVILTVIPVDSYAGWVPTRFSIGQQADPLLSGPNTDVDGDHQTALFEYFADTDPAAAGSRSTPTGEFLTLPNGDRFFTFTFPRAQGVTDAGFVIQHRPSLTSPPDWTDVTHEILSSVPGTGVDLLTVKVLPKLGPGFEGYYRVLVRPVP